MRVGSDLRGGPRARSPRNCASERGLMGGRVREWTGGPNQTATKVSRRHPNTTRFTRARHVAHNGNGRPDMIFQQLVNEDGGCLSYLIGCSQARAAIVLDPARDRIDEYLRLARKKGLKITHILESH